MDDGYDVKELRDEIETRVNALVDFPPGDAETASVYQPSMERWVISLVVSGDMAERDLAELGAQIRDELTNLPEITNAALQGPGPTKSPSKWTRMPWSVMGSPSIRLPPHCVVIP